MTTMVTVTSRGGVTLPKKLRTALGLSPGVQLAISGLSDGTVVMRVKHRKLSSLAGILTTEGQSSVSIEEMSR